jgi:hypothetical protein
MPTEFLPVHDERVPNLPADDQQDDHTTLNIVQDAQVSNPQLEFRYWVRA